MSSEPSSLRRRAQVAVSAVGFVAGLASLFYGLRIEDRTRWALVLVGLFVVFIFGAQALTVLARAVHRYRNFPTVEARSADLESDVVELQKQLDASKAQLVSTWSDGMREGVERTRGIVLAVTAKFAGTSLDVEGPGDDFVLLATVTEGELKVGARVAVVVRATDRVLAILHVTDWDQAGAEARLSPTPYRSERSWQVLVDKAFMGESLPAELALRVAALDDYNGFKDPSTDDQLGAK